MSIASLKVKQLKGNGEMGAPCGKCMPRDPNDLSSVSNPHMVGKGDVMVHTCNLGTGGSLSFPGQPAQTNRQSLVTVSDPVSNVKQRALGEWS